MRRAVDIDCLEALEPANAMLYMHHMVAHRKAAGFGEEIIRPFATLAAHHAVAQNILLADHGQRVGFKAFIEPEIGNGAHASRQCRYICPA